MNFSNEKIIGKVIEINNDDVLPNRFQPRKYFDEEETLELAESIKEHGILQPIVVRQVGDKYEIIAGERRYKANILAGNDTIPAIVSNFNDKESSEIAVIENIQRQDLTPIEEAISYKRIIDMGYITQEELARKIGKSQSAIANKIRLLKLSDEVQDALMSKQISERHARSLLQLNSLTKQNEMLKKIIEERLTVRKTDEEIRKMNNDMMNNNVMGVPNNPVQSNVNQTINNGGIEQNNVQSPVIEQTPVENNYVQPTPEVTAPASSVVETPNLDVSPIMGVPVNNLNETATIPVVEEQPSVAQPVESSVSTPSEGVSIFNQPIEPVSMNEIPTDSNQDITPTENVDVNTNDSVQFIQDPTTMNVDQSNDTLISDSTVSLESTPIQPQQNDIPVVDEFPSTPIDVQPTQETPIVQESEPIDIQQPTIPVVEEVPTVSVAQPEQQIPTIEETNDTSDIQVDYNQIPSFMPEQPTDGVAAPIMDLNSTEQTPEQSSDIQLNNSIETPIEEKSDPIIVTNNETQYDPIMPEQPSGEPTLDFKTIINLIRQCSSTIEKCGYKIDTEEYDLDGKYQVTFVIEK